MDDNATSESERFDPTSFDALFSSPEVIAYLKGISPTSYMAAAQFWRAPMSGKHLSPRMKELIYFAMHACASALNVEALQRQQKRVLAAGGTREDIIDVLISIVGLANHALYASVPVLDDEWAKAGKPDEIISDNDAVFAAAKQRFIDIRGFWNSDRDALARQMPDYFAALTDMSTESWYRGSLTRKEREFVCIGIDCTVTHTYEAGLRIHVRNAIREGATKGEIVEIFQLAALMGLEGFVLSAEAMAHNSRS